MYLHMLLTFSAILGTFSNYLKKPQFSVRISFPSSKNCATPRKGSVVGRQAATEEEASLTK